tara:strand:- start:510 stop:707 length:198 start_codon:yes stop_codon:yes gene_type:complete
MSVNINLHNVMGVKIEKTKERFTSKNLANKMSDVFYIRDISFVKKDGTEIAVSMFSNEITDLINE